MKRQDHRRTIVAACALSQNLAMGFAFGSFGPLLVSTEQHFGISRATATWGMSLVTLTMGLLSPVLGSFLSQHSVRSAMIAGALLSAIGYGGLAVLPSFGLALPMFVLIGIGVCLLGTLGPLTLVSRWFAAERGRMLGIVNLPLILFLTPFLVAGLLLPIGRTGILIGFGALFLLLIPLLLTVVDCPPQGDAQAGTSGGTIGHTPPPDAERSLSAMEILRNKSFWLLSVPVGVISGSGTVFYVHIVPFGLDRAMTLPAAAGLLSVASAGGLMGTLLFGWIIDRVGAPLALAISAFGQALLWWGLLYTYSTMPMVVISALLGLCAVPLVVLHGAAIGALFGAASSSRAMGLSYALKLPFLFGLAPLASILFERSGGYHLPFIVTALLLIVAGSCFLLLFAILPRQKPTAGIASTPA